MTDYGTRKGRIETDASNFLDRYHFGDDSVAEDLERVIAEAVEREMDIASGKIQAT